MKQKGPILNQLCKVIVTGWSDPIVELPPSIGHTEMNSINDSILLKRSRILVIEKSTENHTGSALLQPSRH